MFLFLLFTVMYKEQEVLWKLHLLNDSMYYMCVKYVSKHSYIMRVQVKLYMNNVIYYLF